MLSDSLETQKTKLVFKVACDQNCYFSRKKTCNLNRNLAAKSGSTSFPKPKRWAKRPGEEVKKGEESCGRIFGLSIDNAASNDRARNGS
jgi:hypothetical protein